jgi:hypothetical protein
VHPGLVESRLLDKVEGNATLGLLSIFRFFGGYTDSDTGSWTSLYVAASPDLKASESGQYWVRIAKKGIESWSAKNAALAEKLEAWTQEEMGKGSWSK